ncbi:MAG: glycosyltransferase [Paracoccaceae bacterium]
MNKARPKILFMHRNGFGQFEFFGKWLAKNGWDVTFAIGGAQPDQNQGSFSVRFFNLTEPQRPPNDFRYPTEYAAHNAAAAAAWMMKLRDMEGYAPDVVIAHVGWGVGLCVKQVWPRCRYVAYHEWYYTEQDWSQDGKIERPVDLATLVANRMRTLPITAEFDCADENWCPTEFQANRFPPALRQMITVVPDGVDCALYAPDPGATLGIDGVDVPPDVPLVTYATRGMEPVRGFPQFMHAISRLQKRRSDFHTLVVANDKVAYGAKLPKGQSWRQILLEKFDFDQNRLHLHDMLPRSDYRKVLQASRVHIYFTEPFVTSWSLSEALATGCLVIGSLTAPVQELVEDMTSGILVDMDDPVEVSEMIEWVIENPLAAEKIRQQGRQTILRRLDTRIVFPQKDARLRALLARA